MKKSLLFLFVSSLFFSCTKTNKVQNVEKAFYYWKSDDYGFSDKEKSLIDTLKIKKLYIKFFEVEYNETVGNIPISKTGLRYSGFDRSDFDSIQVIPTVYLKNKVFLKSSKQELDTLVNNVNYLISKLGTRDFNGSFSISELQMDCDWTLKTKGNYFYFLKELKRVSKKKISCTLRLYPYKYPENMGIPPVDKVTLMCYNLINPMENKDKNSILDTNELSLYLNKKRKYPIHMDIALPIYSWMHVYQNNRFQNVLYPDSSIKKILKQVKPMWYEVTKDTVIDDFYLRIGDNVKYEEITADKISKAIEIIQNNVVFDDTTTISLFHLDEKQLNNYTYETLSGFYSDFSR